MALRRCSRARDTCSSSVPAAATSSPAPAVVFVRKVVLGVDFQEHAKVVFAATFTAKSVRRAADKSAWAVREHGSSDFESLRVHLARSSTNAHVENAHQERALKSIHAPAGERVARSDILPISRPRSSSRQWHRQAVLCLGSIFTAVSPPVSLAAALAAALVLSRLANPTVDVSIDVDKEERLKSGFVQRTAPMFHALPEVVAAAQSSFCPAALQPFVLCALPLPRLDQSGVALCSLLPLLRALGRHTCSWLISTSLGVIAVDAVARRPHREVAFAPIEGPEIQPAAGRGEPEEAQVGAYEGRA